MNKQSFILIVMLALITSACTSNALAMDEVKPLTDNSIDETRGRFGVSIIANKHFNSNWSGDDLYDPAAGAVIKNSIDQLNFFTNGNYSGDDLYDPAAGALLENSVDEPNFYTNGSYSGDDLYDPAVGAMIEHFQEGPKQNTSSGFSGDDAYDPSAGGMVE